MKYLGYILHAESGQLLGSLVSKKQTVEVKNTNLEANIVSCDELSLKFLVTTSDELEIKRQTYVQLKRELINRSDDICTLKHLSQQKLNELQSLQTIGEKERSVILNEIDNYTSVIQNHRSKILELETTESVLVKFQRTHTTTELTLKPSQPCRSNCLPPLLWCPIYYNDDLCVGDDSEQQHELDPSGYQDNQTNKKRKKHTDEDIALVVKHEQVATRMECIIPQCLYVAGGVMTGTSTNEFMLFNPVSGKWLNLVKSNMQTNRSDFILEMVDSLMYAIGGFDEDEKRLSSIERYDPVTGIWSSDNLAPMSDACVAAGSCVLRDQIYVIGGADCRNNTLKTVQVYDPSANTWQKKRSLPKERYGPGVTVFENMIYAIGGSTVRNFPLSSGEKYNPENDKWTRIAPMRCPRDAHGVVTLGKFIYAVGGMTRDQHLNRVSLASVERYDPMCNTWTTVAPLDTPRTWPGVVVFNGHIYAIGGVNQNGAIGHNNFLKSVEKYDPATNSWEAVEDMPNTRYCSATIVH